jgi:ribonuclease J
MACEIEAADCLARGLVVRSLGPGYLDNESGQALRAFCARNALPLELAHSSGHADVADLARLAQALSPERVIPIHTRAPGAAFQLPDDRIDSPVARIGPD